MKDRITTLIKAMNFTSAQFADEIRVQKSGISHILSGRNNPSLDFVQKILLRFPEVNIEWLLFGKGSMLKDLANVSESAQKQLTNQVKPQVSGAVDLFSVVAEDNAPEKGNQTQPPVNNKPDIPSVKEENLKPGSTDSSSDVQPENHFQKQIPEIRNNRTFDRLVKEEIQIESGKRVIKIVELYNDNTFREFFPA